MYHDGLNYSYYHSYQNISNMRPMLYISRWTGGGRGGGCWPQKRRLLKGVIKPEETRGDMGRYPIKNLENRGDVVYGCSLRYPFLHSVEIG